MTALVVLTVGLVGLTAAGTLVVRGAAQLGVRFGLSPLVVGLTIVAVGTSAPELAVSLRATAQGDPGLAVGNVVGSNIANVLLVLGLTALLSTIAVQARVVRIDVPVMIGVSLLLVLLAVDGELGRVDGTILAAGAIGFIGWTLYAAKANGGDTALDEPAADRPSTALLPNLLVLAVGTALLVVAARLVVSGAEDLARAFGVPELVIGLTVVALGTSAPELATSLVAAARGERDIAVGNVVGSNVFNILLVLGVTAVVSATPVIVADQVLALDLPVMTVAALACLPVLAQGHRLERWEGGVFLTYYGAYLVFLGLEAAGHPARDPFAVIMLVFVVPLTVLTAATIAVRRRRPGPVLATAALTGAPTPSQPENG